MFTENTVPSCKKALCARIWLEFYDFLLTACRETESKTHSIPLWFLIVSTSYTVDPPEICACFISN